MLKDNALFSPTPRWKEATVMPHFAVVKTSCCGPSDRRTRILGESPLIKQSIPVVCHIRLLWTDCYNKAEMPPSTGKITPFNIDDLSLRRNSVALTTSSGSAIEKDDLLS